MRPSPLSLPCERRQADFYCSFKSFFGCKFSNNDTAEPCVPVRLSLQRWEVILHFYCQDAWYLGIARVFTALMRSVASCQDGICDLLQLLCKGESWEGGVAGGAGTVTVCAAVNRVGTLVQVGPYRYFGNCRQVDTESLTRRLARFCLVRGC